jgi:hypothetical protein
MDRTFHFFISTRNTTTKNFEHSLKLISITQLHHREVAARCCRAIVVKAWGLCIVWPDFKLKDSLLIRSAASVVV